MDRAVTRVLRALDGGERIVVYGDYDVDGLTATALLHSVLGRLGARPDQLSWHIPSRTAEGYGLNRQALEAIRASGASLVVTVDCGVTALGEVAFARSLGLDLVITDHHEPGPELPHADAVVDPKRPDSLYPFRHLAGVGVAYKLAQALALARGAGSPDGARRESTAPGAPTAAPKGQLPLFGPLVGRPAPPETATSESAALSRWDDLLDLVALGTVADVVPLLDENRQLVFRGLDLFNPPRRLGLTALRRVAGLEAKEVMAWNLAFGFAPRLNAAGRMGDAERGLRLLLAGDSAEAAALAGELDGDNRSRQALEEAILTQAVERLETSGGVGSERAIVVSGEGWPEGVIGIVATRLVERYARPALLVAVNEGVGRGSGRSIPAFDLASALEACSHRLGRHGGHQMAAGFEIGPESIADFARDFLDLARERLAETDLVNELRLDAFVEGSDLVERTAGGASPARDLFRDLDLLAPCGTGNPEPLLAMRGVRFRAVRTVGEGGRHLKAAVLTPDRVTLDAIGFGLGESARGLAAAKDDLYDIAFGPGIDEWNGTARVELKLADVRKH